MRHTSQAIIATVALTMAVGLVNSKTILKQAGPAPAQPPVAAGGEPAAANEDVSKPSLAASLNADPAANGESFETPNLANTRPSANDPQVGAPAASLAAPMETPATVERKSEAAPSQATHDSGQDSAPSQTTPAAPAPAPTSPSKAKAPAMSNAARRDPPQSKNETKSEAGAKNAAAPATHKPFAQKLRQAAAEPRHPQSLHVASQRADHGPRHYGERFGFSLGGCFYHGSVSIEGYSIEQNC